jgi:Fe-S-cluster containining protein
MITDADVRRVVDGTKRPIEEILRFPKLEDVSMAQRSPWGIKMNGHRVLMTFKWRRGGACMFLQDDNRCSVYEHRPVVCRQHPFNVVFTDTGGVDRLTMNRVVECPAEWDDRTPRREHARLERWSEREADTYLEQVEAWNRKRTIKRSPREWLRFIGLAG